MDALPAINNVFDLIRPLFVAGMLGVIAYRISACILMGDPKQALRLFLWALSFAIGFFLVGTVTGMSVHSPELVSCSHVYSYIESCNGWVLYGSMGKDLAAIAGKLLNSDIFLGSTYVLISSVSGLILIWALTRAVYTGSSVAIIRAFVMGTVVFAFLMNPGYFLELVSGLLGGGLTSSAKLQGINEKIESMILLEEYLKDRLKVAGLLQTLSVGSDLILHKLLMLLLDIALLILNVFNLIMVVVSGLVLSIFPSLVLVFVALGSFSVSSLFRWVVYLAVLKVFVVVQLGIVGFLPNVTANELTKFSETSVALLGSVGFVIAMVLVTIFFSRDFFAVIWERELKPAGRMFSVMGDGNG